MSAKSNTSSALTASVPPPPTAVGRPPTSLMFSRGNLSSSSRGDRTALARPSTAVRGVGYAPNTGSASQRFDQRFLEKAKQQTLSSANAAIDIGEEINPQIKYKNLEHKITKLLESSIELASAAHHNRKTVSNLKTEINGVGTETLTAQIKSMFSEALNKAKEAFSLDRTLHRFRDQNGENIFHNFDLTYSVFFNLAEQYENNDLHIEALNTYSVMTKNKMFPHVNQLKLNMGNIYYRMGIYGKAIKMYRMALDSVPNNLKQLRLKITRNIGILFVRMGQYADAASSFEFIMSERADIHSGIHLILCYYALSDVEKMKSTFRNLCDIQQPSAMDMDSDLDSENHIIKLQQHAMELKQQQLQQQQQQQQLQQQQPLHKSNSEMLKIGSAEVEVLDGSARAADISIGMEVGLDKQQYILQALKTDDLAIYMKQRRNAEKRALTMIVDFISPIIEENYNDGYNWCVEVIKSSNLSWLAQELELNKALVYLRQNDVQQAIETLQMYDRKADGVMTANALTNLCFIYINLGNLEMAQMVVQQMQEIGALQSHAMALINAGVVDMQLQQFSAARAKFERALQIQPDSFEANYNLGLVAISQEKYDTAEEHFEQLKAELLEPHSLQHNHVFYQLACIQEKTSSRALVSGSNFPTAALQSYLQVLGISQPDSKLCEKIGTLYEQMQDHQEALQYYHEAHRINPSDVEISSSIGAYYVKLQSTEKAIYYYERAVLSNPRDPQLMLRIASCLRHSYMPPKQYLTVFQKIHALFPDSQDCVRALMQVTKSIGMTELHEKYAGEYAHLRALEQRNQQQRLSSARARSGSSRLRALKAQQQQQQQQQLRLTEENFSIIGNSKANGNDLVGNTVDNIITANFDGEYYVRATDTANYTIRHTDPLGPPPARPLTGKGPRPGTSQQNNSYEDDDDDLNAESLLPL